MKWFGLVLILFCSNAFGSTPKEIFFNSCAANYYIGLTNRFGDNVSKDKVRANAKSLCSKETPSADMPMFKGCLKAVQLIYSDDMSESYRRQKITSLVGELCASIGDR